MGVPVDDVVQADCAHAQKPGQHDGCEEKPHTVGAVMLEGKQEY
jgi:hypothetical protein